MSVLYGMLKHRPEKGSPAITLMAKIINSHRDFLDKELGMTDVTEVLKMAWQYGQNTPTLNRKSEAELIRSLV